tara:strand:- start:228 stop:548 length:321 start_codon:yes stop_codon:yes gene_type:complete
MLSTEEIKAIAAELRPVLVPEADPVADASDLPEGTTLSDNGEVMYTDPTAQVCDEVEGKALNAMPMGVAVYRGKNGSQIINHSQETLEAIAAYRKNRRQYNTRTRM